MVQTALSIFHGKTYVQLPISNIIQNLTIHKFSKVLHVELQGHCATGRSEMIILK